MAAARYRKFLKLCEIWPIDAAKVGRGRDLGTHIRELISKSFSKGEMTRIVDEPSCDETYESLHRIATNLYKSKYPRSRNCSATNCTLEELKMVTSSGGLEKAQDDPPFSQRFSRMFGLKT